MSVTAETISIEEQAAHWIAREDGVQWNAADEAARDAWLHEAVLHRVAYLRLKAAWDRADRLAALRPGTIIRPVRAARVWFRMAAGFVLFALLCAGAIGYLSWPTGASYATPVGAHETVHLADGSILELNTDTHVRATVDGAVREIVLERGEVFLEVVHDARRPFTVLAGNRRITDLGTKFSVARIGNRVKVMVTEGKVRIDDLSRPAAVRSVIARRDTQVIASADGTLVAARTPQQVTNALSWRNGILTFNQDTLADAAAEFNRYNARKLVLEDSVAQTRIGGSFQAANVEAFARLLHEGFGFTVVEADSEVRISQ